MRNDAIGLFWEDLPAVKSSKVEKVKRQPPEPTWLRDDYLPYLNEARLFNVPLMTDMELIESCTKRHTLIFDIECYINYFLVAFKCVETGKVIYFEKHRTESDFRKLQWVVENFCIVGFNSLNYDIPMLTLALSGASCAKLKEASDSIIQFNLKGREFYKEFKVKKNNNINHIDLIEVAPSMCSLKTYGGRMHTLRMQDLPFVPNTVLSNDQVDITRLYCVNDLDQTIELFNSLESELSLRYSLSSDYGIDLRSKSDAQIAEAVIAHEIEKITGNRIKKPVIDIGTSYKYNVPHFIQFTTPLMNTVLNVVRNADFVVGETGAVGMPEALKSLKITMGNTTYTMGIGGLHSTESASGHVSDTMYKLIDRDVTSYYPFIILNQNLYPKHLGQTFLQVYNSIVQRRLTAKRNKNKKDANSLKIVINGSFGKLGSKYSILYSPDLLIQVTISGQLSLLMLIEQLELAGIPVVSANTDGIVMKCPVDKEETLNLIIKWWEGRTNFETEETQYKCLYSRDVNSYIAVVKAYDESKKQWLDEVADIKSKGSLAKESLQVNPTNAICVEAIKLLLTENIPVSKTINECKDIRKFLSVRNVKGGAVKCWARKVLPHKDKEELVTLMGFTPAPGGNWVHPTWDKNTHASLESAYDYAVEMSPPGETEYLGKVIRWYYGTNVEGEIVYAKNGNKVPRSDSAVPLMEITNEFPKDLDHEWYINEAYKILENIGYGA